MSVGWVNDFLMRQCRPQLLRNGLPCPPISYLKWPRKATVPPTRQASYERSPKLSEISVQFVASDVLVIPDAARTLLITSEFPVLPS